MALVIKDRVKETTTTTGTGAVTLAGAPTNFQTFTSVLSNADTTFYAIIDDTNGDFEVGIGTFASSGTTLTRTTVLESSNSGSAVNLGSGTKQVFMTYPAEKSVYLDANNQLVINGTATTSTAAELSILDGDTSATSTTVADADRVVLNDNGTMKQVAVTDLAAYFDDEITAMPNLVTTAATTVGALNSGSITSGFGTIDTGSSTITTTGLISGGSLDIDDVLINGTTIGHTDDTDLITLADGVVTVAGEISVTTLDIGGTNVTATAAELNIIDGGTSASSTTVADADRVVFNDDGTMKQVAVTDLAAYFDDEITAMPNLVTTAATTVGALNSGSITSGFGSIDNGSSAITTTGTITYGSLSDGSITITAFVDEDDMDSNSASLIPTQQSVKAYVDSQVTAQDLDATTDSGTIDIDLDSETLTIAGGEGIDTSASGTTITITGEEASTSNKGVASFSSTFFSVSSGVVSLNAAQTGITSLLATDIKIGEDDQTKIDFETADTINFYAGNEKQLILTDGALTPGSNAIVDLGTDSLEFKDAYFDGTVEADAITIGGTALSSVISGTTVDLATSITVSANNSTDETVYPLFVDGATGTQGAETDTGLTYNPSSGLLTISGELDAGSLDISGNADIAGTLEADAITVDGTALNEYIADTTGAMFSSNTETGVTVTYQDGDNTIDVAVDAAQTTITSLLATDIKIGEDDQTKIDFETADEIHFYAANAEQVYVADGIFGPQTDSDVDLGSSSVRWKDAYVDSVTTTGNVTVGGNLSVTGTTTTVNTVTMEAANAIVFEGATADAYETTLSIVDPTADHTQYLINQGGYIPVLAAATTTAITSTPAELNILDGVTSTTAELNLLDGVTSTTTELNYNDTGQSVGTVVASKTVTVDSNKDVSSFRNVTLTGELDAATLDISGNADIAGDLTLSAGGDGALQFSAASSIKILDNSSASLVVEESDNAYMTFVTTNGSEAVKFDKALDLNAAVQLDSTLTIGANDTGYDVKFFGGTSGAYMLWDEDVDDLILAGAARVVVPDGQLVLGSTAVTSTAAELNIMDGVTATATELNIMDGDTSASSTTVADADRVVLNDNGTMKQVAVTDLSAYFDDEITAMPNLVTTAATTVGALNSGSITSGFGTIDTGSSAITTTGLISGGSLDIDDVVINGTTIGHTDDTDLITVADGLVTIAGEISTTTLDIGGTNVTSTAAELNILDGVTSTATELNIMDGNTSASSTTLVDADRVVANDNGTMKQVALTDIKTYLTSAGYASQDDATALAIALG